MTLRIQNPNDATIELFNAIEKCRKENIKKLVIEEGVYHLHREKAFEKFVAISNCDNILRRVIFPLKGFQDFEIDGSGSDFICHGHMLPFQIEDSENIVLKNFTINWFRPFFLQAVVTEIYPEQNAFDIQIHPECRVRIVNNDLLFFDPEMIRVEDQWVQNLNWNVWFDPETRGVVNKTGNFAIRTGSRGFTVTQVGDEIFRLKDASDELPEPGWILVSKGRYNNQMTNRSSSAIHINRSTNINIENITIYHAGGIGLVAERSADILIDSLQVRLPPGSDRIVTTTADATHFVFCRGNIEIRNSYFENMLDDATNIHGNYTRVVDVIDNHTIGVQNTHQHQLKVEIAGKGDKLSIVDSEFMPLGSEIVKSVDFRNSAYTIIEFEKSIAGLISDGGVWVENISWYADKFTFRNCIVKNNMARSIVVSNTGEVIIEDNVFDNPSNNAIRVGEISSRWVTSGPVNDLLIRNNIFKINHSFPAIRITPSSVISCVKTPEDFYNENVRIIDNSFELSLPNPVFYITHTQGIDFFGNKINLTGENPYVISESIILECTEKVRINNNTVQNYILQVNDSHYSHDIMVFDNVNIYTLED